MVTLAASMAALLVAQAPGSPAAGDRIRISSPGGGGYGDPAERDIVDIERDIRLGYVSEDAVDRDYPRDHPSEDGAARGRTS